MPTNNQQAIALLHKYKELLISFSEEQFVQTPPAGGWSYSEVFTHIIAANDLAVLSIYKCTRPSEEPYRPMDWRVKLILFFGALPPGKYKVPSILADKSIKCSKEEATKRMDSLLKRMETLSEKINEASKVAQVKHPRLGYLNAEQWSRFILIHTKHHLKQLARIKRDLNTNS